MTGRRLRQVCAAGTLAALATYGEACRERGHAPGDGSFPVVLRVGVAQLSPTSPIIGLRQVSQILTSENLARPGEDGRMQPSLAESWTVGADGRSLKVNLRSKVKFQDGSSLDANETAAILPNVMRAFMGPVFSDVESIRADGKTSIDIAFRGASPFLIEALDVQIQKPGKTAMGTGPYMVAPGSPNELQANKDYYLGRPHIDTVRVETYPSVRAAWAEMLRGRLDMLWEVGSDAIASMQNSSTVSVFTFTRRYQHVIVFNTQAATLRASKIRRALSMAINRASVVQEALNGRGVASSGPIWPHYWALPPDLTKFEYNPTRAAGLLGELPGSGTRFHFTCLVSPDSVDERIALEIKRQLASIGVDMAVEEASRDEIVRRAESQQYEAVITEVVSGPTLFRPYLIWHSKGSFNWGHFGTPSADVALDRVRHAPSEPAYREAVAALQQTFIDDPPAIFLAWSQQSRAVSTRFIVPTPEPGREILSNLRMWTPAADNQATSRN